MRTRVLLAGACLLAGTSSASAASTNLALSFIHPENFTDAGYSSSLPNERERAELLHELEQHLQQLVDRSLPPGETLRIEVLDIDLAGRFEPFRFRAGTDVRVLRDITWPRIALRYALNRGDQLITSAEELLTDMNYLRASNRYPRDDRLRYEKAMLDDWFAQRIVRR